ncbi:putative N-acetyltransferase B complex, non-catalytic subunit [Helianthus debilis subsp. tardiflorus]
MVQAYRQALQMQLWDQWFQGIMDQDCDDRGDLCFLTYKLTGETSCSGRFPVVSGIALPLGSDKLYTGSRDETVRISAKVLLYKNDSFLIDDLTLSTLQIVFQRLDHLDMATSCCEYACGKFPNNLELMMGLFSCYIAIKMYKVAGEEKFFALGSL